MHAEQKLSVTTSAFVLAAAITVLVNTVLACAKDANAPIKAFMKSIAGHDWTTQGLFDLVLFVALGLIFAKTRMGKSMDSNRLIATLIGAVAVASLVLALWYAFI
jgi:uncharacterized membrane protein SirB2